jgi:hypothetical protein
LAAGFGSVSLVPKPWKEAKEEAVESIGYYWKGKDECSIQAAELLEVSESVDLSSFLDQKKVERETKERAAKAAEQQRDEEAEFERLKRKLGK